MTSPDNAPTCHWLTPTRILPHPFGLEPDQRPWTCLRESRPRALNMSELHQCETCQCREPRTLAATRRDLVFETWGVGIPLPTHRTFDEVRRDLVWETWGVT